MTTGLMQTMASACRRQGGPMSGRPAGRVMTGTERSEPQQAKVASGGGREGSFIHSLLHDKFRGHVLYL